MPALLVAPSMARVGLVRGLRYVAYKTSQEDQSLGRPVCVLRQASRYRLIGRRVAKRGPGGVHMYQLKSDSLGICNWSGAGLFACWCVCHARLGV